MTGTIWLSYGISGSPASPSRRFTAAPAPDGAARSAWLSFRWRTAASAPAAKSGGNALVKMNPGAWPRRKSTIRAEPAT